MSRRSSPRSAGGGLVAIACTHTHRDHSPASRALAAATGAPIVGCAPLALDSVGPRADASFDVDYRPDRVLGDGEAIMVDGEPLIAVATPGHTSNHLCFAYRGALFTGDHVMGWSTTRGGAARRRHGRLYGEPRQVAAARRPHLLSGARPGGDQAAAIGARDDRPPDAARAADLEAAARRATARCREIVAAAYPGLDPRLVPAAGGSVTAHLLDLERRGMVEARWMTNG